MKPVVTSLEDNWKRVSTEIELPHTVINLEVRNDAKQIFKKVFRVAVFF